MTRFMFDSVNPAAIPLDAQMVAGYINGRFDWAATPGAFARWPNASHIRIDVNGSRPLDAAVLDVEIGDATPAVAARWVAARTKAGFRATVYCNRTMIPAVQAACKGLKFDLWVATLDGNQLPGQGHVAVQFMGAKDLGFNADKSIVYDDSWHPVKPPAPSVMHGTVTWDDGKKHRPVQSVNGGKTWR